MFNAINKLPYSQSQSIAWQLLLAAREIDQQAGEQARWLSFDESTQRVLRLDCADATVVLWLDSEGLWRCAAQLPPVWQTMFDLYLPLLGCRHAGSRVVAHLGQSLDACIATLSGDSFFVTGEENRKHLHCLRALNDAVIIGAGTAMADDPQLTTRAVPGHNPVRIVIDPTARLPTTLGLCCDGQARTILLHQASTKLSGMDMTFGPAVVDASNVTHQQVERWVVPDTEERMAPRMIVRYLASRGLKRLFVEGGGITVSGFLEDDVLHRLHVAVAPLLVGQGIKALQLAGSDRMQDTRRPPCSIYRMGEDVLWDFDVGVNRQIDVDKQSQPSGAERSPLERIEMVRLA